MDTRNHVEKYWILILRCYMKTGIPSSVRLKTFGDIEEQLFT